MINLQRVTGMRPGEVVMMRTADIDRSGAVWIYTPPAHKMLYRGRDRRVYIGPAGQAILAPWLKPADDDREAYLFSPREARAQRFQAMRANRKTRVQPSQKDRKKAGAKRVPGEHYTTRTYYHAILHGCARAFDRPDFAKLKREDRTPQQQAAILEWNRKNTWHPNQLRHNAATRLRKEFGLDVARVILGHTSPVVTEVYAEMDQEKALSVIGRIG
jgi:integrase